MVKAVIFDRDATLNETTQILRSGQKAGDKTDGYVLAKEELKLFPAVQTAMQKLRQHGITPFVFTQQNSIGKGLTTKENVDAIHQHMNDILGDDGKIEAYYVAWQVPYAELDPRAKPSPAMILEILNDYGLEKEDVIVIGDSMRDYQSAKNADVQYMWVRDDLKRLSEVQMQETDCPVFDNVLEAVDHILNHK